MRTLERRRHLAAPCPPTVSTASPSPKVVSLNQIHTPSTSSPYSQVAKSPTPCLQVRATVQTVGEKATDLSQKNVPVLTRRQMSQHQPGIQLTVPQLTRSV